MIPSKPTLRRLPTLILAAASCTLPLACGNKGPLVRPPAPPAAATTQTAAAASAAPLPVPAPAASAAAPASASSS